MGAFLRRLLSQYSRSADGIRQAPDFPRRKVRAVCAALSGAQKNRPFKKACFLSRLRGLPSRPLRGDASPPEPARAGAYKSPFRSQMSSAYSRMVLSDEKKPILAVLFMAIFAQRFLSRNASSTFCWTSQYDW